MAYVINYLAEIGWKIDWQEAALLNNAAPIFLNNTQPNRGLNKKASNYSDKQGFDLYVALDATISQDGVNTTYRSLSPKCKANNYDEPSVSPRDFTEVLEIFDLDGNNITGFLPNKTVLFRTTYTLINGGDIADYADAWGIHRIQIYNNTSYNIFEFSSAKPNLTNQPLLSDDGLLSVTYDGNKIITECYIDGTQLTIGNKYVISARLGLPNVSFEPPTALIDNITPDVEIGITEFDITLDTPYGVFSTDDTIEIKVYNNNTSILIETLTGNYGSDITTFTSSIAIPSNSVLNFLSGVVTSSVTMQFDKLGWAIENDLINDAAIPLKLTLTITQFETGLISNVADGIFSAELQPAEFISDLRYITNDGRKLYSSNFDGVNLKSFATDITLGFSELLFTTVNGDSTRSIIPVGDSTFGSPLSKLLLSEIQSGSPYQTISINDTADGTIWTNNILKTNIAGTGIILNLPTIDDLRTYNSNSVYWVGTDLATTTKFLYMLYYDGAAWQVIDFTSLITTFLTGSNPKRVKICVSFDGDLIGYACDNGVGGQKKVFRLRQTSGTKTTFADFSNPANWTSKVMAGNSAGSANGNGTSATFSNPYNIIMLADDTTQPTQLWVADGNNNSIRELNYNGGSDNYDVTTPIAMGGDVRGLTLNGSFAYVGDLTNLKIKKINTSTLAVTDFSGNGISGDRLATLY